MKKIAILMAVLVVFYVITRPKKIIDMTIIDNKQVILFKKTCKFESIYLTTESGVDISQVMFSNAPGEGVYFKENTYIIFNKFLNVNLKDNKIYELSSITGCGEYPIYRRFLKFKKTSGGFETIAFN